MPRDKFNFPEMGPHAIKPWAVRKGYADEHFLSDYRYQFPREDPNLPEVFVYTEKCLTIPARRSNFMAPPQPKHGPSRYIGTAMSHR